MAGFFADTWRMPNVVTEDTSGTAATTERAFGWSFDRGDVLTDGSGRIVPVDGEAAWRQWIVLACLTQRAAYAVNDRLHGADLAAVRDEPNTRIKEATARRTLSAAAFQHPDTLRVDVRVLSEVDDVMLFEVRARSVRGAEALVEVGL